MCLLSALLARVTSPQQVGRRTGVSEPQLLHSLTWASKDVVLYYTSTKYETLQVLLPLGLTFCLKLDPAVVWIEEEKML